MRSVSRIYAIAINTFREAVRDRVLYGVLGFAFAVLLFTLVLAELSLNEQERVVSDVGLASISFFSVVVAIFLGSSLLYKEIERKTLYVILPKPIGRTEFLLGKYAGIFFTAAVFVLLMGALQMWTTSVQAGVDMGLALGVVVGLLSMLGLWLWRARDKTAVLIPYSCVAIMAASLLLLRSGRSLDPVLAQLALSLTEVLVLAAVALFFSSFSTPFLTGVFTLGIWLLGRSADDMATMKSKQLGESLRAFLRIAAEILPNLQLYVPGRTLLYGESQTALWSYVGKSAAYGMLYATLLLVGASVIFKRRDFV